MDVGTLERWLWDAACEIRGPLDGPKFKDDILSRLDRDGGRYWDHLPQAGLGDLRGEPNTC